MHCCCTCVLCALVLLLQRKRSSAATHSCSLGWFSQRRRASIQTEKIKGDLAVFWSRVCLAERVRTGMGGSDFGGLVMVLRIASSCAALWHAWLVHACSMCPTMNSSEQKSTFSKFFHAKTALQRAFHRPGRATSARLHLKLCFCLAFPLSQGAIQWR